MLLTWRRMLPRGRRRWVLLKGGGERRGYFLGGGGRGCCLWGEGGGFCIGGRGRKKMLLRGRKRMLFREEEENVG